MSKKELPCIGWREWVSLPDLQVKNIKVKVDTGAKTSSLHAFDLVVLREKRKYFAQFKIHPEQKSKKSTRTLYYPIVDFRKIKSSNGQSEWRPVIEANVHLGDYIWPIEITLTNRDEMGFRMLLGRESIKDRFLVNVARSYIIGKRPVVPVKIRGGK
ncbi:MAG: ATP-dependent zinc protease [Bdellovibrionales bacterium]|nr:ATP-dependent zinc protease [Bdellovibrionales bacterium]